MYTMGSEKVQFAWAYVLEAEIEAKGQEYAKNMTNSFHFSFYTYRWSLLVDVKEEKK